MIFFGPAFQPGDKTNPVQDRMMDDSAYLMYSVSF